MLAFAYYLLKVIICSAVLFGYYWFFLRNKVFHAYNRFYLLAIIVLSVGLPVTKFNIFNGEANKTTVVKMLQVVTAGDEYMDEIIIGAPTKSHLNFIDYIPFLYAIISAVFLMMLIQMLASIFILLKKNEKINIENIHFINTDAATGTPFSFFKYIFWNKQIDINSPSGSKIFKHEIAHVQQRHSWDKMFINIILIVFWSNPVFWLIRKELSMIHEFIADKQAVEDGDTAAFAAMILQATYPQKNFYITNNFFYSPIKRRLMMLTRNQHPRMNYISRLLALPLLIIVFGAFTIKIAEKIDKEHALNKLTNKIIVVIDAGHGGQDNGAVNKDGITEKDLTLQLIKKIKALNTDENIQIILSRENDVFSDPRQKAAFAKSQNADLFISVHLDNGPKQKWNTISGMSVFVAKDEIVNAEKSKLLASSIIGSFKNNYDLNVPQLPTQRTAGVWILTANDFPSVLIEAGYLSNDKDLAYLQSVKGQEAFAKNVLNAIRQFSSANLNSKKNQNTIPQQSDSSIYYKGKKVKNYSVSVNTKENKITGVKLFFYDNTTKTITAKEAYSTGVVIPPVSKDGNLAAAEIPLYLSDSIRRNNESVNLLMNTTKDSAEMVYLLEGKKINNEEGKGILSSSENDIQVYDSKAAFKSFGMQTKNGLINILKKSKVSNQIINSSKSSVTVGEASTEDVKLFQKLGHVFMRSETDGELPYKGPNRLVFRDGKPQFSKSIKTYKGDIMIMLSSKEAIEKYGETAFGGAVEITSKEQYEKVSGQKVNLNQTISDKVFTQVEVEPEFPGGKVAWRKFLETNLNGSMAIKEGLKVGSYTFITKFIVHEDGSISDFTSEKNINDKLANHCIEVLKNGPKWIPAKQNGHIVTSYKKQPITFVIIDEKEEEKKVIVLINPSFLKNVKRGAQSLEY